VSIPDPAGYTWVQIAESFLQPLFVTNAGDGSNRLFVVGQQGQIWIISDGQVLEQLFLDIRDRVGSQSNEQGLLGIAFHPEYMLNGFFYVNYTDNAGDTVISRFSLSSDPNVADPTTETVLLQVDQPFVNHNGGPVVFGPDGMLYIGLGDGGSGGDPRGNAQSRDTLLGKILRIDVDNGSPYAIPSDNPFANEGGLPEIWAYGIRNPWGLDFDDLTGDLYFADVGQNIWEEINFLPAAFSDSRNFGWRYFEGNHLYSQNPPPEDLSLISPVAEYDHSNGRCSVTGGQVYRGDALPAWQGVYLYGDFCSGEVFALVQDASGSWQNELVYSLGELITSFGMDESGEIYLLGRAGGLFSLRALP
jgi:glucose/arabinose dehydrogenase